MVAAKNRRKYLESIKNRFQFVMKSENYVLGYKQNLSDQTGQSKIGHPCQQLASFKEI
jgi:hypothetical protein